MKKLSLKKQKVTSLSSNEMNQVIGGGEARSDRRNGHCNYSSNHPDNVDFCTDNGTTTVTIGCTAS